MKVLITGAKGMLGQDLCPIFEDESYEVIETDYDTMDVTDISSIEKRITGDKPKIVIHCAAYTNVDAAETEIEKSTLINAVGVENIAKICANNNILLIYISTDYVFDGEKQGKYLPNDKPNPLNQYGLTKLKGEQAVLKHCEKYYIVRTSWLYGHYGKNFVETMISLAKKQELKVVDDQIGCPTWTVELANGILDLIEEESVYGIYHICGSGETSWYGFAKEIFSKMGLNVNLIPCGTDEFPQVAKRPKYSAMENDKTCRNWKAALKDYLNLR